MDSARTTDGFCQISPREREVRLIKFCLGNNGLSNIETKLKTIKDELGDINESLKTAKNVDDDKKVLMQEITKTLNKVSEILNEVSNVSGVSDYKSELSIIIKFVIGSSFPNFQSWLQPQLGCQ